MLGSRDRLAAAVARTHLGLALVLSAFSVACGDGSDQLLDLERPPEKTCMRPEPPRSYEVYFVIDVSGSMGPFLELLSSEIVDFSRAIPDRDALGRSTRTDYYVIGFVNDVRWFPAYRERMTSDIAVQDAFERAILAGKDELNLNTRTFNIEVEENLLDGLSQALEQSSSADARLVFLATDAEFVEAPAHLSGGVEVHSTFQEVRQRLEAGGFRVHSFVPGTIDGVNRAKGGVPPLSELPGSTVHDLTQLMGTTAKIGETLVGIAEEASCN